VQGAAGGGGNVAHVAHLGGAAFGLLYAWQGHNMSSLTEQFGETFSRWTASRRGMKIYRGDDDRLDTEDEGSRQAEVDRILEKISRSGEASLTSQERDTLTRESRRIKQRRQ